MNNFIRELRNLHDKCQLLLSAKDYDGMIRLMENYMKVHIFEITDADKLMIEINELKIILIITKSFKEHDLIGPIRAELKSIFENKLEIISLLRNK